MATDKTIAVKVAVDNVQDAIRALKGLGDAGKAEFERIVASAANANQVLDRFGTGAGRAASAMSRFGPQIQQAGYQIGDFAVQVAGGQNALVAFAQQGGQLAGMFGPAGAVVGAILGVAAALGGTLIPKLFESGDAFSALGDKSEEAATRIAVAAERAATKAQELRDSVVGGAPEFTSGGLKQPNIDEIEAGLKEAARIQSPEVIAAEAKRLADTYGSSRDPKREREEALGVLRDIAEQRRHDAEDQARADKQLNDERARSNEAKAREVEQNRRLIAQAEDLVASTQRTTEATGQGAYALKLAAIENEKYARILQASQTLKGKDLEYYKQLAEQMAKNQRLAAAIDTPVPTAKSSDPNSLRRQAEQEGFDQAGNVLPINTDQARREAERAAAEQADILLQPFRNLAGETANIFTGIFDDFLSKGKVSADALGKSLTDTLNQSFAQTLSSVATLPLNTVVSTLGQQLTQSMASGQGLGQGLMSFAQQNPALVAGAGGILAGQVSGQLLGLQGKYSGVGGLVGSGAGFMIGNALLPGIGGVIGAGAGGFLGSLGGGLFGAENNLGNDRSTQVYGTRKGEILYSDKSYSSGNRSVTGGILGEVQQLQEALGDMGATFKNINLRVEAGNKSGITVNGKKYDNADDALRGAIEQLLLARTGGLNATQQTILANTKGKNASEIGQDLAFGQTYDRLVRGGNQFDQALQDLNETFDAATRQAAKLKLDTNALAAAREREAAEIARQRDQATRGVWEQLAAARGDNSLGTQLFMLETQMRELAKAAADLGIPLEEVTKAHEAAAKELEREAAEVARQRDQATRGVWEQLAAARGDNSLGTQLFMLETQMRELAKAAADLGIPLEEVTKAHEAAAKRLIETYQENLKALERQDVDLNRQLTGQVRGIDSFFTGLIDPLRAANDAGLSPLAQIASARREFQANLALARGGDLQGTQALAGSAQELEALRERYLGSGGLGAEILKEIQAGTSGIVSNLEQQQREAMASVPTVLRETVAEQVAVQIDGVNRTIEAIDKLRREIELQRQAA